MGRIGGGGSGAGTEVSGIWIWAVGRVFQAQDISGLKAEKHRLGRGRL